MVDGLTEAGLGPPDYPKALAQHEAYVAALTECGLQVHLLEADEAYPDSTFVEDAALLTPSCAIITRPGAPSRRGETESIRRVVDAYFSNMEEISTPGTVEAGDIMMVGKHYFIGCSSRTNQRGAEQLISILEKYGMSGSIIRFENLLHLKTGASYIENNNLLVSAELINVPEFKGFNLLEVPAEEAYAANSLWINGRVLVPGGFPATRRRILDAGYQVIEVEMSEFRKLDGGLSCLSLRW